MIRKVIIVVVLVFVAIGGYLVWEFWGASGGDEEVIVRIPDGAGFAEILDSLESARLIDSRATFRLLAVATGKDDRIQPGAYKFTRGLSNAELLDALVEGRSTVRVKVTFPEGITIRRMASILAHQTESDSSEFVRLANDRAFLQTIGINASTAEGYLMPDTYFLFWGEKPAAVLKKMAELFRGFYNDSLKSLAAAQNLTPYEAVVLASIVEGEARIAKERPTIAGLYLNRLRRGIKLEADPTVQYIIPDGPRRLLYRDLEIDSPYNTYRYKGLPPAPINNPSRASVLAVLKPARHDYIFMVARADGSGEHTFSRTAVEHQSAVREYRRRVGTH